LPSSFYEFAGKKSPKTKSKVGGPWFCFTCGVRCRLVGAAFMAPALYLAL
jgi:hypothetical protein